ncbi:MAG: hypothetical protein IJ131_03430 [Eggerthellaceae bacterium]|nr:hypothetical protein [Eggerthellaceae bacterium]
MRKDDLHTASIRLPGSPRILSLALSALLAWGVCAGPFALPAWADNGAGEASGAAAVAGASDAVDAAKAANAAGAACEPSLQGEPDAEGLFAAQEAEAADAAQAGATAADSADASSDAKRDTTGENSTKEPAAAPNAPDKATEKEGVGASASATVSESESQTCAGSDALAATGVAAVEPSSRAGDDAGSAGASSADSARAMAAAAEDENGGATNSRAATANATNGELPASYDARSLNLISPVRLQDPWGACWAFASLAAMEANLVKQGLLSTDSYLSPRHAIYFAGTPVGDEAGAQAGEGQHPAEYLTDIFGDNAVFEMGGHSLEVASYVSAGQGVALEVDYPYQNNESFLDVTGRNYGNDGTWALDESARYDPQFGLRNMVRFPDLGTYSDVDDLSTFTLNEESLDAIKRAIVDYGAVSVSYRSYRNDDFLSHFDEGNATFFTNSTRLVDHDVCIVGWDDSFPREKFTTGAEGTLPEGDGAWIVKNSWGAASAEFPNMAEWGDDGYCYLSYYDRSAAGFTAWEMMSLAGPDATSIINQYNYMDRRSNSETRVADYSPENYANVFTAEQNQAVRAVSVNTYAPGTEVTIQVYALGEDSGQGAVDPTAGTLLAYKTLTIDWGGYHRLPLDLPALVRKGQRFAVVVSMVETDREGNRVYVASIEAGNNALSMDTYGLTHFDTVIVNEGETSVLVDLDEDPSTPSVWIDGTRYAELIHEIALDAAYYGNANIKAFADPYEEPEPQPQPELDPQPQPEPQPTPDPAPSPEPDPEPGSDSDPGPELDPSLVPEQAQGEVADNASQDEVVRPAVPQIGPRVQVQSTPTVQSTSASTKAAQTPPTADGDWLTLPVLLALSSAGMALALGCSARKTAHSRHRRFGVAPFREQEK